MTNTYYNTVAPYYKKGDNNDNYSPQLSHINNSLLISIFDTPGKGLSRVERKAVTRKVCTYLLNSYSTLFSCSVREMYNIVWRLGQVHVH